MGKGIRIKNVEIYHPERTFDNDYYINHFKKQGKNIDNFLNVMGRSSRYISANPEENSLTMGVEASKKVLEKSGLCGNDIDLIVFSSGTPEYLQPTNAIKIHNAIEGKDSAAVFDMSANCVGMVYALDQVCRYIEANPHISLALIVGAEQMNRYSRESDEICYPNFGDGAAAVILERVDEGDCGLVDSIYYTNSELIDNILLPGCGYSKMYSEEISIENKKLLWVPFDGTVPVKKAVQSIKLLIERNGLLKEDIKLYLFSQFSKKNIELIADGLGEQENKFVYVGHKFGYTGISSPFIALYEAIQQGKLTRGDNIMFWSVGAGWTICTVLFKY